jgi:hypothetical protein
MRLSPIQLDDQSLVSPEAVRLDFESVQIEDGV